MNDEKQTPENAAPQPEQSAKKKETRSITAAMFDYVEMFAWAVFIVMILFSFGFRICRVDGSSMEDTLQNNQTLLLRSAFYTPKQDDIVVFHLTDPENNMEKTLVKRVIALEGQTVRIDLKTKIITVDGVEYADSHKVLKNNNGEYNSAYFRYDYNPDTQIFETTVPVGCVFVMGDNRNNSMDSRNRIVGFVDKNCILGGVVMRLSPFTFF